VELDVDVDVDGKTFTTGKAWSQLVDRSPTSVASLDASALTLPTMPPLATRDPVSLVEATHHQKENGERERSGASIDTCAKVTNTHADSETLGEKTKPAGETNRSSNQLQINPSPNPNLIQSKEGRKEEISSFRRVTSCGLLTALAQEGTGGLLGCGGRGTLVGDRSDGQTGCLDALTHDKNLRPNHENTAEKGRRTVERKAVDCVYSYAADSNVYPFLETSFRVYFERLVDDLLKRKLRVHNI